MRGRLVGVDLRRDVVLLVKVEKAPMDQLPNADGDGVVRLGKSRGLFHEQETVNVEMSGAKACMADYKVYRCVVTSELSGALLIMLADFARRQELVRLDISQ